MALTPAAAWSESVLRANPELRYAIEIYNGTTTWYATSGDTDMGYPEAVRRISNIGVELDGLSRKPQSGSMTIEVDDLWLRPIMVNNRLKNQQVTVKLGTKDLATASYLTIFTGIIQAFAVNASAGSISIEVEHGYSTLEKALVVGAWINEHPLTVAYDIIVNKAGWPAALVDTNAFDPAQAVNAANGHYVVSLLAQGVFEIGLSEPESALDLVTELLTLLNAQLTINEAGQFTVVIFDSTAGAVDSWGGDDILPGSFEQEDLDAIIIPGLTSVMIPKCESAFEALKKGVKQIWILEGRLPLKKSKGTLIVKKFSNHFKQPFLEIK